MIQIARGAWYNVLRISLVMRVIHHMSPARLPNARHGFADVTIATPKRPIMTSLSLSEGHLWQWTVQTDFFTCTVHKQLILGNFLSWLLLLELFRVTLDILLRLVQVVCGFVCNWTLSVDHHFVLLILFRREEGVVRGRDCVRDRITPTAGTSETYLGFHALTVTKHLVSLVKRWETVIVIDHILWILVLFLFKRLVSSQDLLVRNVIDPLVFWRVFCFIRWGIHVVGHLLLVNGWRVKIAAVLSENSSKIWANLYQTCLYCPNLCRGHVVLVLSLLYHILIKDLLRCFLGQHSLAHKTRTFLVFYQDTFEVLIEFRRKQFLKLRLLLSMTIIALILSSIFWLI